MPARIEASILGASGYTGVELLRILAGHPAVRVIEATSRQYKGKKVVEVFPWLLGFYDGLVFTEPEEIGAVRAGCYFTALPHGASQEAVAAAVKTGAKVVDLSADFRLRDKEAYAKWYGQHNAWDLVERAVYGLPELHRDAIRGAGLVANPGCYPTGAALAAAPLAKGGLIDTGEGALIIDSKSGVSGAGRQAAVETSFVEITGAFKPYKIGSHRHAPEMGQEIGALAGRKVEVAFTPHLLPVSRGILTTAYIRLTEKTAMERLHAVFSSFYEKEPFVKVLPAGQFPDIRNVRGSNFCHVGVWVDGERKLAIVVSAIDNLVKGASGQAVQNMNLIFGLEETTALLTPPLTV